MMSQKTTPCLHHVTLFKTLKDLPGVVTKPAMEGQFTALQFLFTQRMDEILDQRIQVLANIQVKLMHRVVDQLIQDKARLQSQLTDLTREV